jgi:hypothetical protein
MSFAWDWSRPLNDAGLTSFASPPLTSYRSHEASPDRISGPAGGVAVRGPEDKGQQPDL